MYSLLQDETECMSQLGTLIYTERKIYGFFAKISQVIVPESRFFGHVEYKIEIKASPHNAIDNEPRIFTLVTRFKEVSKLHATLGAIHRNLYLKDKFPPFAEAKLFGTSDPETIIERQNSIENFLQFSLNSETLCKSKAFQTFLENTKEEVPTEEEKPGSAISQPEPAANPGPNAVKNTGMTSESSSTDEMLEVLAEVMCKVEEEKTMGGEAGEKKTMEQEMKKKIVDSKNGK